MNFRSDFLIEFGANSIVDIPFLLSFQEVRFNETIIGFPPPNGRFIASRNVKMPKFSRAAPLDPPAALLASFARSILASLDLALPASFSMLATTQIFG